MNKNFLSSEVLREHLKTLDGWKLSEDSRLTKMYKFGNFAEALAFVNKIGVLAERHNHHPDICLKWGEVFVTLWSHDTSAISKRDLDLARAIESL